MGNFNFVIKTFLDNDYLIKFIFDTINLRFLLKCKTLKEVDKSNNNKTENFLVYTFFYRIFMINLKTLLRIDLNVRLSFFSLNKLDGIIKA